MKASAPTETQIGSVKVIVTAGDSDGVAISAPDVGTERAREFLKEHLYGSRLKRAPGIKLILV